MMVAATLGGQPFQRYQCDRAFIYTFFLVSSRLWPHGVNSSKPRMLHGARKVSMSRASVANSREVSTSRSSGLFCYMRGISS